MEEKSFSSWWVLLRNHGKYFKTTLKCCHFIQILMRYPKLSEADVAECCHVCRYMCNCKTCLRMVRVPEPEAKKDSEVEKFKHSCYILHKLLPWFKGFKMDQILEKELKAKIQGIELEKLELGRASFAADYRVYWNFVKVSYQVLDGIPRVCKQRHNIFAWGIQFLILQLSLMCSMVI